MSGKASVISVENYFRERQEATPIVKHYGSFFFALPREATMLPRAVVDALSGSIS